MFFPLLIISGIVGLLVGSFLNVVMYRYNTGKSAMSGRSQCLSCGATLSWYELIPFFSFLFQGGKCRSCGTKISWQYPLVELTSAALFILVFLRQYNLYQTIYSLYPHGLAYSVIFVIFYDVIVSLLLIIAVYDMRHKIIPNAFVYWFIGLGVLKLVIFSFVCLPILMGTSSLSVVFTIPYVLDLLAPIIFFIPFWLLWLVSKGTWIGFGDAKLVFGIGALLGLVLGLSAIVLGFWIGALICLAMIGLERFFPGMFGGLNGKSQIPLGPFLILGVCIVLFSRIDVLGIAHFLNA